METVNNNRIPYIEKEAINDVIFTHTDVLKTDDEKRQRNDLLQKAMFLGNANKCKSKITFSTTEGFRKVETTVWSADDMEVQLKAGTFIPVHAIIKVDLL